MTKLRIAMAMLLLAGALGLGAVAGVVEWTRAAEPARDPLAVLAGSKSAKEPEKKPGPDADAGMEPKGDAGGPVPKPKDGPLGMKFVPLPKATFYMGWDSTNKKSTKAEIKADFEIAVYTVTQGQWEKLMGNNLSYFSRAGGGKDKVKDIKDEDLKQFPVEMVSWEDTQKFIKKLNEQEKGKGWMYRLPTEAEWECACRGGATSEEECSFDYYYAKPTNDLSSKEANFYGNKPAGKADKEPYLQRPTKVGSYAANKLGLHDMHGNVWQWCEDLYDPKASGDAASNRVLRGGGYGLDARYCRAAHRFWFWPGLRRHDNGLRLARVPVR